MLREVLVLNILLCPQVLPKRGNKDKEKLKSDEDLGRTLITSLRNDVNLDLSMDEDYEDLRAELLAYHTALASLAEDTVTPDNINVIATPQPNTRRSLKTTACWQLGGICIPYKLCQGHRFLTEIPGCKNKLEVCCFSWNKFQTRDFTEEGIRNIKLPWSKHRETGMKHLIHPGDLENENSEELTPEALQVYNIVGQTYSEDNKRNRRDYHKKQYRKNKLLKKYHEKESPSILIIFQGKKI